MEQNNNSDLALTKQSRPLLAKINEDFPKIRDIVDTKQTDPLINYLITLLNIKVSNESESKDLQLQMLVIMDFVKEKFGDLTVEEIKQAFKMYVAKEFPDIKVFRILDSIVVGDVLNAFREYRNESLRTYSQKKNILINKEAPISQSEKKEIRKNLLKLIYTEVKENSCSDEAHFIYEDLIDNGLIKITDLEKKILYKKELEKYNREETEYIFKRGSYSQSKLLEELKHKINSNTPILTVQKRCKNILVNDFLNRNISELDNIFTSLLEKI